MSNDGLVPPATSNRIQEILHDPAKLWKLKIELAVTIDAMEQGHLCLIREWSTWFFLLLMNL